MRETLTFEKSATAEVRNLTNGTTIILEKVTKVVITEAVTIISAEPEIWQFPTSQIRVCYIPAG